MSMVAALQGPDDPADGAALGTDAGMDAERQMHEESGDDRLEVALALSAPPSQARGADAIGEPVEELLDPVRHLVATVASPSTRRTRVLWAGVRGRGSTSLASLERLEDCAMTKSA